MRSYFRRFIARKYLMRIILSINLLIVSFMLVSLLSAYLYSERISLDSQREANEKVLSQINYNITYMNEVVKNYAVSFFYDNDMAHLLYSNEPDNFEDTVRVNKLYKTIAYNTFIHSILIYNSKRGVYFASGDESVRDGSSNLMQTVEDYLAGRTPIYKMQLMPVEFIPDAKHPDRTQAVFSLYMYDALGEYDKSESAVIVNIRPEWLFEKVELLNRLSSDRSNRIFILDQNRKAYSPVKQTDLDYDDLKDEVYRHIAASPSKVSQFTYSGQHEKQLVNYIVNDSTDWIIVDVESYRAVLAPVHKLKIAFIVVAAVCFVLALLASLFVSNKLYSPIKVLFKQTKRLHEGEPDHAEARDEFGHLSYLYNHLIESLTEEKTKQKGHEPIIRSYYLRKLMMDSQAFAPEELRECVNKKYLNVNPDSQLVIGVLEIDNYDQFASKTKGVDRKLLHFAISNIILELVSEGAEQAASDIVDIRGEHLALVFAVGEIRAEIYEYLSVLIARAQHIVNEYYHVTFTVALSGLMSGYREMTYHYKSALDSLAYKMNYGANSVITPQMLKPNLDNEETQISLELERKLMEAIKAGHQEEVYRQLDKIRGEIAAMSSDAVVQSVIHLGMMIKQTVREISLNKLSPLAVDLRSIDRLVFEKETLDEIFAEFKAVAGEIFMEQKQVDANKDQVIVDTIKDVIQANYMNANLSLQEVSDMLRMSSGYVGRIFKKYESLSVAEYLNEVRLLKSLMLLEKKNLQVSEIAEKVGFGTQSYFFKMFKKRFGTTPREYRTKKSLS